MKHGTPGHIKMRRLARTLGIPRTHAVGLMACLWDAVPDCALAGDIGRYTNAEIADTLDWPGDPDVLIDAMVDAGWLDRDSTHRLVIHNWQEHAQGWVKKRASDRELKLINEGDKKPFNVQSDHKADKVEPQPQLSLTTTPTKLALPPLSSPPFSPPPPPTPEPSGGGGGGSLSKEREAARRVLIAEPWPMVSPSKARAVAEAFAPDVILAAVKRGREANERGGVKVGGGLIVSWIESGDMAALLGERALASQEKRRRLALERWWTPAVQGDRDKATACYERETGAEAPDGGYAEPTPELLDFIAERLWPMRKAVAS